MTIEELNSQCIAIDALDIKFNYFNRILKMVIKPAYGYKHSLEGRVFQLNFEKCIFLNCSNLSQLASKMYTEFTSWGKKSSEYFNERTRSVETKKDFLIKDFLSKTISAASLNFAFPFHRVNLDEDITKNHTLYSFENVWGDAIWVICSKTSVSDITDKYPTNKSCNNSP